MSLRLAVAACFAALAAAAASYMLNVVPLPNVPTLNLSTHGYDIVIMDAPVATGTLLHVLAWVLTQPAIGPLLTRFLLNNNKVWHIRELAAQVPQTVVFKPLPAYSVDAETMKRHQAAARQEQTAVDDATDEKAIRIGMPSVYAPIRGGRPRYWGAAHYREAYETKATTPTSVADALLVGRARLEAQLGTIFTEIHPDLVREQAAASTRRWAAGQPLSALDGVPIAVKEMVDIAGHRTAAGARRGGPGDDARLPIARTDDPIVARFRAVGALIIGQAAMTEYGVTPLGWSMHAQGPSNPFNASHYSGGSSSGSAVAVATGLVPIAIGFDGGGSIRIPAALSGVVGLACGYGRVPFACDATSSMTHAGPLSSRVHDAALAYWLMARPPPLNAPNDPKHTTTHGVHADGAPPAHLGGLLHHGGGSQHRLSSCADLAGIRIGVFTAHADDATAEVRGAAREARAALTRLGATLVEIELPQLMSLSVAHGMLISSEFASDHDREYADGAPLEPSTHIQLALGRVMTAAEFVAANKLRSWGMELVADLFRAQKLDAIAGPTAGLTAPLLTPAARATGESNTALIMSLIRHIFLANLLGLPAISVPIGLGQDTRLPIGFQFLGAAWEEAKLLHLACALEGAVEDGRLGNQQERPLHFFHELDGLLDGGA